MGKISEHIHHILLFVTMLMPCVMSPALIEIIMFLVLHNCIPADLKFKTNFNLSITTLSTYYKRCPGFFTWASNKKERFSHVPGIQAQLQFKTAWNAEDVGIRWVHIQPFLPKWHAKENWKQLRYWQNASHCLKE